MAVAVIQDFASAVNKLCDKACENGRIQPRGNLSLAAVRHLMSKIGQDMSRGIVDGAGVCYVCGREEQEYENRN